MTPEAAREILAERIKGPASPCEQWSPELKGRALEIVRLLAVSPPSEWESKSKIHAALADFR